MLVELNLEAALIEVMDHLVLVLVVLVYEVYVYAYVYANAKQYMSYLYPFSGLLGMVYHHQRIWSLCAFDPVYISQYIYLQRILVLHSCKQGLYHSHTVSHYDAYLARS
jgi:hypothetical protein